MAKLLVSLICFILTGWIQWITSFPTVSLEAIIYTLHHRSLQPEISRWLSRTWKMQILGGNCTLATSLFASYANSCTTPIMLRMKTFLIWGQSSYLEVLKAVNKNTEWVCQCRVLTKKVLFCWCVIVLGGSETGDIAQAVRNCERRDKHKSCDGIRRQGLLLLLQS